MSHPYRSQPARAFWSRAVSQGFEAHDVPNDTTSLFESGDRVMTAGSCFASNLIPWIEASDATYVRTEVLPPRLAAMPENLGYRTFSAAYGNIYTARHLRQLLQRAYGEFQPVEDRWYEGDHVIDPFRPGLRYPAVSDAEFDALTAQHLAGVRRAVESATVLVFTLGLTEAWESTIDGSVYPGCPGTIRGTFDPDRHRFINFTASEVRDDVVAAVELARRNNPSLRVILTVSPVPLVATATDQHVLVATTYSKSALRVAAGEVAASVPGVRYFPAYEIITGPQAPDHFYEPDRRNVSAAGVRTVMSVLFGLDSVPTEQKPPTDVVDVLADLSRRIADAECDEVLAER